MFMRAVLPVGYRTMQGGRPQQQDRQFQVPCGHLWQVAVPMGPLALCVARDGRQTVCDT